MDKIVIGGRKEYLSLPRFKEITVKANKMAKTRVKKLFDDLVYYNFGFVKIPTFNSLRRVEKVLVQSVKKQLLNTHLVTLVHKLLKQNSALENRENLYENKIKSIERKLVKAQRDVRLQVSKLEKIVHVSEADKAELEKKSKQIKELNNELAQLAKDNRSNDLLRD